MTPTETPHQTSVSIALLCSYVVDWIVIVALAAVGAAFSTIVPNRRPFDLADPSLSYPLTTETISTGVLVLVGLIGPAVIIFVLSLLINFCPHLQRPSKAFLWRWKLWEWNAGWMGLGLAVALSFLIVSGAKQVAGKPRPDFLARCDPDLSRSTTASVGGIGQQVGEGINLVSWTICRKTGSVVDEGFRSFPSGHASISFSGLTYLALWVSAKFSIAIPMLSHWPKLQDRSYSQLERPSIRSQAAAPPTYLVVFPLFAVGLATYVSLTRYSDFWHHGFDIIVGAILGIATAWLGFYWYQLPIQYGRGWAWAPRNKARAFGHGIGISTYGDDVSPMAPSSGDLEHAGGLNSGEHRAEDSFDMAILGPGQTRQPTA